MKSYKMFLIFILVGCTMSIDICKSFQTYQSCIGSEIDKCMWDNVRNLCYQTNDYLQGCSLMLNKPACLRQIGDVFGELSKCRYTDICEDIPDLTKEYCSSNLSKSGCLSVQNPNQVCKWVNDACVGVNEALWINIQDDFDQVLYSASACSHIENYLVMHHTLLWPLIDYTPDLVTEADNIYKKELGIEVTETVEYDDAATVSMQNNYVQSDGTFAWYTIRVSKSITLTNLRKTSRTREGCIALEVGSDSDFTAIFSLTGEVRGVNHVYCKYLNNNPSITDSYVYSNGGCTIFEQKNLNDQSLISQLNCYSLNLIQCIYFDSLNYSCQIRSDSYEYPCIPQKQGNTIDCGAQQCTAQQCRKQDFYYIEETNNNCENTCLTYYDYSCPTTCQFFGLSTTSDVIQNVCGPLNGCDEVGMNKKGCQLLKAKCSWSNSLNRCFTLSDSDIQYMKCIDASNIYVCTLISLSDQLCFWDSNNQQCINVIDQPLLITHFIFINDNSIENTICNMNLCKHNDRIPTEYDTYKRICKFNTSTFSDDKTLINKYRCIKDMAGYCLWDVTQQICVCLTADALAARQCTSLKNVNEKLCQKAKVSNNTKICIYDSVTYSCLEQTQAYVDSLMCAGNGLSENQCVLKNNNGEYCQYSAGLCQQITENSINSIRCTSLQQVNQQVCKMQSIYKVLCVYDTITNSCYSPSLYNVISYNININRYACQAVTGSYTFFDTILNVCTSFTSSSDPILNNLTCEGLFVNQATCVAITTVGQYCYWDTSLSICRNYPGTFNNCDEYKTAPPKVCQALQTAMSIQFMKENYCSYSNSVCATNSNVISDCGTSEQMNIHRCSGMTGLDSSNVPTNMCAFVNHQCVALQSGTMDTYIMLHSITCIQANLKTCVNLLTPGEFCFVVNYTSTNSIIVDRKCQTSTKLTDTCTSINSSFNVSIINPNHCARAVDACKYTASGCAVPSSTTLPCSTQGLSKKGCIFNTQNYRCAFLNNSCQFLPFYTVVTGCTTLNQYVCQTNNHQNCVWSDIDGCQQQTGTTPYINDYTCQQDNSNNFIISNGSQCITIAPEDYIKYSCDTQGLNKYGCHRIPNQFCQFHNNKCEFYVISLCEDTLTTCSQNQSYNCVAKDNKCFSITNTNYLCDYFDQTNYGFCHQFTDCVYYDNKCHQRNQQTVYTSCTGLNQITCTIQNKKLSCQYDTICKPYTENIQCPSLNGFYSYEVCNKHSNCQYGYTKSGLGFCYSATDFTTLTCEKLSQAMCLEDLIHLNSNLFCYWDSTCKTIPNFTCEDLQPFQTNFGACNKVSTGDCKYSHEDHYCKPINEYTGNVCQGTTAMECNYVQKTCYFDGTTCSDSGTSLNKYGCITQSGQWRFNNGVCESITDQVRECQNKSKSVCLSNQTNQLHCKWDGKCLNVLEYQNKQITSCLDLNENACLNVRLSSIQCSWDSTNKICNAVTISSTDCSLTGQSNSSISLCGSQTNSNCIRYSDGTKCTTITVSISDCNKYGLNEQACLTLTTAPCQWIVQSGGGYCDNANLYQVSCSDLLNQSACAQVKSPGQYCQWNSGACQLQTLTGCASASGLNGEIGCKAVISEACEYDPLTNMCSKVLSNPLECSNRFNLLACKMSIQSCSWNNNECVSDDKVFECSKLLNRKLCLTNSELGCKWTGSICADYRQLDVKIFCKDLPTNINDSACRINSIDPCFYDTTVEHCLPAQINDGSYTTVSQLLLLQQISYTSPLLFASCESLTTQADCIASRKEDQACQWNSNCETISDLSTVQCTAQLNIYGCLGIKTQNQLCQWTTQCIIWDNKTLTNVNINVCIQTSVNSVYINHSCQKQDLSIIDCNSPGLSMITCLSLSKKQCYWTGNQCQTFIHTNQSKCSDFTQVSPYVCQMQTYSACIYDSQNHTCQDAPNNSVIAGASILACLSNTDQLTYWNTDQCEILMTSIECDSPLQVNALVCATVSKKICVYDKLTHTCTSSYNPNSLRCSTVGLNYYACLNVTSEPCIYLQGACTKFVDTSSSCMTLTNVNAKTCASLVNQDCLYDAINFRCQTPLLAVEKCETEGVNKDVCESSTLCKFNKDHLDCQCSSTQQNDQCQIADVKDCKSNTSCYFEGNVCVKKQCYHLTSTECTGTVIDGKTCYISNSNGCQPAKKCEDIVDPQDKCQSIFINSNPCVQAATQCISANNFELFCPFSDCLNTNCFYEQGVCRKKRCTDYPANQCADHGGCYLTGSGECQELSNCSQINSQTYGEENVLNVCNQLSVNGFKCNYQRFALLDDTLICTNQPCELYGPSTTLCQGNENNGYSCFLSTKLVCQQCETITESCYCNKQVNVCAYSNGKCQSLLCSSFLTKERCAQATGRCYWSTQLQLNDNMTEGCAKECVKIADAEECNGRIGECYYEYLVSQCKKGQKVIPSLTLDITIEPFYGLILQISLILYAFL